MPAHIGPNPPPLESEVNFAVDFYWYRLGIIISLKNPAHWSSWQGAGGLTVQGGPLLYWGDAAGNRGFQLHSLYY